MLQYKLKRFYTNFDELKNDILKFHPDAKIQDDYFKVFVVNGKELEKLIIQHHSNEIEIVR